MDEMNQETQTAPESAQPTPQATAAVTTGPEAMPQTPANNQAAEGHPAEDWKVKYDTLLKERDTLSKRYNDATKKLSLQGAEKNMAVDRFSKLEAQLQQMSQALTALAPKPVYDPHKFAEELLAGGPDYLNKLIAQARNQWKSEEDSAAQQLRYEVSELKAHREYEARVANKEAYPDFDALSAEMNEMYLDNQKLFDSQFETIGEKMDALYNAVKLRHSQDAILKAEELGRKKTEQELVREAQAGGTGGGRIGVPSTPDPKKMTAAQMKDMLAAQGLVE